MVRQIFSRVALGMAALILASCSDVTDSIQNLRVQATSFPVTGVTSPGGVIRLDGTFWVSDHLLGFCRMDGGSINQATCRTNAASHGQPSFQQTDAPSPGSGIVFVPDNSSKGQTVWRYAFNASTGTITGASALSVSAARPTATAIIGSDLFVGYLKSDLIHRVVNGATGGSVLEVAGQTSDGGGVASLAAIGGDLYLAETTAVTRLLDAAGCSGCLAEPTTSAASVPTSLAAVGADLFIGDSDQVLHFRTNPDPLMEFEEQWATGFAFPSALYAEPFDADNNPVTTDPHDFAVYLGDDPTDGEQVLQGYVDKILYGEPGQGGGAGPALTTGLKVATGLTSPGGLARLGNDWWTSDHTFGFCRLDPGTDGLLRVNQATCFSTTLLASPGQPSVDTTRNLVYVPDNSSKGRGVWRIPYNPTTRRLGTGRLFSLGTNRATATALSANGRNLYVGYLKTSRITRIRDPFAASLTTTTVWGRTGDGRGAASLALADDASSAQVLYLAESAGVAAIPVACSPLPCRSTPTTVAASAPLALASNGANLLFVADGAIGNQVLMYRVADDTTELLATQGIGATGPERGFKFASALTYLSDATGRHVYSSDDPTDGTQVLQGATWDIVLPSQRGLGPKRQRLGRFGPLLTVPLAKARGVRQRVLGFRWRVTIPSTPAFRQARLDRESRLNLETPCNDRFQRCRFW